jgi:hypothetical protein
MQHMVKGPMTVESHCGPHPTRTCCASSCWASSCCCCCCDCGAAPEEGCMLPRPPPVRLLLRRTCTPNHTGVIGVRISHRQPASTVRVRFWRRLHSAPVLHCPGPADRLATPGRQGPSTLTSPPPANDHTHTRGHTCSWKRAHARSRHVAIHRELYMGHPRDRGDDPATLHQVFVCSTDCIVGQCTCLLLLGGCCGVVLPQLVRCQLLQLARGQARDGRPVARGAEVRAAAAEAAAGPQPAAGCRQRACCQRAAPIPMGVPVQAQAQRRSAAASTGCTVQLAPAPHWYRGAALVYAVA